jgi:peptide deformylase
MELKLRYYGDPILRERAAPVETFDDELRELAESMVETMYRERGIGLAAPQVGVSRRLIVALQMSDLEDEEAEPVALVNPEVVERSRETWEHEEGCLSIPEVTGLVTRPENITVRYQDLDGQAMMVTTSGMFGRILLHEIDHVNGRLFIDYLSDANKSLIKPRLREIAARYASPSS